MNSFIKTHTYTLRELEKQQTSDVWGEDTNKKVDSLIEHIRDRQKKQAVEELLSKYEGRTDHQIVHMYLQKQIPRNHYLLLLEKMGWKPVYIYSNKTNKSLFSSLELLVT